MAKDNFSERSDNYARYRPTYPQSMYDHLFSLVHNFDNAWDCGTGNGQVAVELAGKFKKVYASDISQSQLDNATKATNIIYSVQPAEETSYPAGLFDLVVVAQAVHWFNFERFYNEVRRTAKDKAVLCLVGYGRVEIAGEIDRIVDDFYFNIIGKYWDEERHYIDEGYKTIPFPFEEINAPSLSTRHMWSLDHFLGYLNTWSAVKHFIKKNSFNPVKEIEPGLRKFWGVEEREVCFPLMLRIGRIKK